VAGPTSVVGQAIVSGEQSLTEAQAKAAFQFMQPNFALLFVPDIALGEEISIVEEGTTSRASVPYSGTTVQGIPVEGSMILLIDEGQVAGIMTLTTDQETLGDLFAEMVGSISLSAPGG
jgi:hypothetical protein